MATTRMKVSSNATVFHRVASANDMPQHDIGTSDGAVSWEFEDYETINIAFSQAAKLTNIDYVWGGSRKSFKDGPHFELKREG